MSPQPCNAEAPPLAHAWSAESAVPFFRIGNYAPVSDELKTKPNGTTSLHSGQGSRRPRTGSQKALTCSCRVNSLPATTIARSKCRMAKSRSSTSFNSSLSSSRRIRSVYWTVQALLRCRRRRKTRSPPRGPRVNVDRHGLPE